MSALCRGLIKYFTTVSTPRRVTPISTCACMRQSNYYGCSALVEKESMNPAITALAIMSKFKNCDLISIVTFAL